MNAPAFNKSRTLFGVTAVPAWNQHLIRRHVARHATHDDWTAEASLTLVETICAGRGGLDRAAAALRRPREECLEQWNRLMPESYRGGIDNQAGLLAALREVVA